jgi:hypothetical protein
LNGGKHPQQLDYSSGVKIVVRVGLFSCLFLAAFCLVVHQYFSTNVSLHIAVTFTIVNITLANIWWTCIFKGVQSVAQQMMSKLVRFCIFQATFQMLNKLRFLCKKIASKNSKLGAEKKVKDFASIYLQVCALLEDAGNVTAEAIAMILILGEINFEFNFAI